MLNSILKRKNTPGNKNPEGITKEKILRSLSKKSNNTINLALELGIKPKNVRFHLENLKKDNKITISKIGPRGAYIWSILK